MDETRTNVQVPPHNPSCEPGVATTGITVRRSGLPRVAWVVIASYVEELVQN